jgi:hypothetical protein
MARLLLTEAGYAQALGNYVSVPQADAVAVARLEAQALRMRAGQGGACAWRWRYAARIADRIVADLQRGDSRGVVPLMHELGRAWHRAASCSGVPSPIAMGATDDVVALHSKIDTLTTKQRELYRWTRYGTYATIAAVIVGAARAGLIAIPFIQARKKKR